MTIDSQVKDLVFLFSFSIPSTVNGMFLITDTFPVLPGGRWDIPPRDAHRPLVPPHSAMASMKALAMTLYPALVG